MRILRGLQIGLICILLLSSVGAVYAQVEITFREVTASHVFSEQLSFEADISTNEPITNLELVFQPAGRNAVVLPVAVSDGHHLKAVYQINQTDSFAPFTKINFWFIAYLEAGGEVESEVFSYTYTDNRYTWQSLENNANYRAHWVNGDHAFGQAVLDAVTTSFSRFEQYLTLPVPETLDIYIYPSSTSMQSALETSGTSWVSGHADPGLSHVFAVVSGEYDERFEIESTIPHEVTHIRLYLLLGENYANLPAWLNEGISLLSERIQTTDWSLAEAAQKNGELYAFSQLCNAFPGSGNQAGTAYAQSESLVRYIFDQYGKIGLQALLEAYRQGYSCDGGVQAGLGISLADLEANWYQENFNQVQLTTDGEGLIGLGIIGVLIFFTPLIMITVDSLRRRNREKKKTPKFKRKKTRKSSKR
jgi:hypothetical protein